MCILGVELQDNFDGNEDEVGIDGDRCQIMESGANDANEDEVIQETEVSIGELVPETDGEFEGSPVQGLITSLENLVIDKDDVAEHTKEEEYDEIKRSADEKGKSEEIDPEDEIPGVVLNSIIHNQVPSIPDCDNEVKVIASDLLDEVSAIHAVSADHDDEMLEEVKESDEILAKVAGSTAKSTGEAIEHGSAKIFQFCGADKENGIYSELNTQVVVNDKKEQNVLENLSLRKLKMYKEKINDVSKVLLESNYFWLYVYNFSLENNHKKKPHVFVDQVETKRQALNDVNHNIV